MLLTCLTLGATPSKAALFDAADFSQSSGGAASVFGDVVLNDPSGEGLEARYKWISSVDWNLEGVVGWGSNSRRSRFALRSNYNLLPDTGAQPGISLSAQAGYWKRFGSGGVHLTAAPMIHKSFNGINDRPMNLYLGIPWGLYLAHGSYVSSWELAFGVINDISDDSTWFVGSEAGISLNKGESSVLIGVGARFGGGSGRGSSSPAKSSRSSSPRKGSNEEFRTEDFAQ